MKKLIFSLVFSLIFVSTPINAFVYNGYFTKNIITKLNTTYNNIYFTFFIDDILSNNIFSINDYTINKRNLTYDIIQNNNFLISNINDDMTFNYKVSQINDGSTHQKLIIKNYTLTPEPATFFYFLLGINVIMLLFYKRKLNENKRIQNNGNVI